MANTALRLPPFGPLLNTADAITRVLAQTKDYTSISSNNKDGMAPNNRFTAFDDVINSIIVPELDKYKVLDRPSLLEGAFKMKLFSIQNELGSTTTDLTNALFRCLDLIMRCAELELIEQLTPIHLLEEVLDLQTVECAEQVYNYLESNVDLFASGIAIVKGKGLSLLRICNELLRRLSKAKNTVLCGRILMLLSSVFPITERSGVNLKGEFNMDNVTLIESDDVVIVPELVSTPSNSQKNEDSRVPVGEAMDVDQEAAPLEKDQMDEDKPEERAKAQSQFYTDFWSLQTFFNNPTLLINSPSNMTKFQEGIDKTLTKFASIEEEEQKSRGQRAESASETTETPTTEPTTDSSINQTAEKRKHSLNKDKTSPPTTYFPKFLTSPKLLQLEIVDPYFRKHILVQFLIMVQYLQSHNLVAREAQAKIVAPNRQFLSQWVLNLKDEEWAQVARPKILKHLKATGLEAGDSSFLNTVEEVVKDDENWVQWKAEGCYPFEKPSWTPEQVEQTSLKRKRLSQKMAPLKQRLGCANLTGLWREVAEREDEDTGFGSYQPPREVDSYLSGIKFVRNREKLIRERKLNQLKTTLTPAEEEGVKEKEQGRFWRALRLGVRQYLHLYENPKLDFDGLVKAIKEDEEFEEMVRENGGKVPEPPVTEETAADDKTKQAEEDAAATETQEQAEAGDKETSAKDVDGTQEDEDMKETDATEGVAAATENPNDSPAAVTTSPPAEASVLEAETEVPARDDESELEKAATPSPSEKPTVDGDIAMEEASTPIHASPST
ncbi:hypothetical protein EC991_001311 [Linnemannia zychae]|nr:hypothetical protein EC991_001311 [Linnemannia zychae]